jgi:hypothetical protein|tara:strand:- start:6430 stop:6798 length:369 start_codon:yes stop_codon:yes gene_type:complete
MEQKKVLGDKSKILVGAEAKLHYVKIEPDSDEHLKVWIKEPTYLQLEQAQMKLFNVDVNSKDVSFDMNEVYRYLWDAFVHKTEPALTAIDLLRLKPYVGSQIKAILPDPFSLMEGDDNLKEK